MFTSTLFPAVLGVSPLSSLDYWLPFIGIAGGYIFGALLTWLLLRNRLVTTKTRLEERLRASEKHVADLEAGAARLEEEVSQIRKAEAVALKQQGLLEAAMNAEKDKAEEKIKLLDKAESRMLDSFRLISRETMNEGQSQFVTMAAKVFEGQLEAWRNDCEDQIRPLTTSLDEILSRLDALEKSREGATRILREQIARAVESEEDREALPPAPAPSARSQATPPVVKVGQPPAGKKPQPIPAPKPRSTDPRPYAAPSAPKTEPVPAGAPRKTRSTPSTFMEDLDDTPLGARPDHKLVAPVAPIPQGPPKEEKNATTCPDVLDTDIDADLDEFEGFEAENDPSQPADPKRAADDLRAALES